MDASASSMRRRLSSISATTLAPYVPTVPPSTTKIGELEAAIVALDQPLDLRACVGKLFGRGSQTLNSFLEQLERACELELIALELRHDCLEALEIRFECHGVAKPRRGDRSLRQCWPSSAPSRP